MNKNTVRVYDTIAKKYVEVKVTDEVYTYYKRTGWAIENNDKSFYEHEIQFSMLKGNIDGSLENFHEFRTENDVVEKRVIQNIEFGRLYKCLDKLSDDERKLVTMIYFENKTEAECASLLYTTQQNIHKKKHKILCKLNKLLRTQ